MNCVVEGGVGKNVKLLVFDVKEILVFFVYEWISLVESVFGVNIKVVGVGFF